MDEYFWKYQATEEEVVKQRSWIWNQSIEVKHIYNQEIPMNKNKQRNPQKSRKIQLCLNVQSKVCLR